ncbi:MAG TPA: nitroreductase family protein [Candidatus Nanoarchaeia archaeon]|nr:nitroreductase family protein [Candidatus Nanoarchaeia archaeon]
MEFDKVIEKRRSVRAFKNKPASWRAVVEAVDAARTIPLAGNNNTLRFLAIMEGEKIEKIAEYAEQLWINQSSIVVIVCSDEAPLEKTYGERGRIYSRQHAGAAIMAFLLKLVDLGLSGCWVGAYDDKKIRSLFDIPENIQIEALIPIGYEKTPPATKYRRSLKAMIYWQKWDQNEIPKFFKEPSLSKERFLG